MTHDETVARLERELEELRSREPDRGTASLIAEKELELDRARNIADPDIYTGLPGETPPGETTRRAK